MAAPFKRGDVVQLKSGGPKMTVEDIGDDATLHQPTVWCVWFDEKNKRQESTFRPAALKLADEA